MMTGTSPTGNHYLRKVVVFLSGRGWLRLAPPRGAGGETDIPPIYEALSNPRESDRIRVTDERMIMKIHTFEDGQVIVLSVKESMGLNKILNTYLDEHGDTGQMALKLAGETYSEEWS
jgi:hypothetical protein